MTHEAREEIFERLDRAIGVLLDVSSELQLIGGLLDDMTTDDPDDNEIAHAGTQI